MNSSVNLLKTCQNLSEDDELENFGTELSCDPNNIEYLNPNRSISYCSDPEYYNSLYGLVGTIFQSSIFLVGVLGNLMVVITVRSTKSLHTTTNCYLVSLALADLITLLSSVPQEVLSYHILGDLWLWGGVGCSLIIYCQFLAMNVSALSLTAFTVERYIAICHPMKAQYICTITRAKRIIICCWTFALCYSSPWLVLTTIKLGCVKGYGQVPKCDFKHPRNSLLYIAMFFTDITLFYLIPLVLSVVLYTLISIMLLFTAPRTFNDGTIRNQARLQVVKMLIAVVTIFATLWLPHRGLLVYNTVATLWDLPRYMDLWYLMFAKTCIYINSAINPMLYSLMSTKFRRAFRRILSCNRSPMYDPRETTCATPSVSHMASTRVTKVNNGEKTAKRPYSERNGLLAVTDNKRGVEGNGTNMVQFNDCLQENGNGSSTSRQEKGNNSEGNNRSEACFGGSYKYDQEKPC